MLVLLHKVGSLDAFIFGGGGVVVNDNAGDVYTINFSLVIDIF